MGLLNESEFIKHAKNLVIVMKKKIVCVVCYFNRNTLIYLNPFESKSKFNISFYRQIKKIELSRTLLNMKAL